MTVGAMQASVNLAYDEARYKEASRLADHIREVQENTLGADNTALVGSWIFATRRDIADGQLEAAGADIDRAAAITSKSLPPGHPFNIDVLEGKADVAAARGDLAGVERYDREAQALADKLFGQDHSVHIAAVNRLIGSLGAQGKLDEAEALGGQALVLSQQRFGPDHLAPVGRLSGSHRLKRFGARTATLRTITATPLPSTSILSVRTIRRSPATW